MHHQRLEWHDLQARRMGGLQVHRTRLAGLECLEPGSGADTPLVAIVEPRKTELWRRRDEIVATELKELEELERDPTADGVRPGVLIVSVAAPIPEPAGERSM